MAGTPSVSTDFILYEGVDVRVSPGRVVVEQVLEDLLDNDSWLQSKACRRDIVQMDFESESSGETGLEGTDVAYTTVGEFPFTFSSTREGEALTLEIYASYVDVQVLIRNSTDTVTLSSGVASESTGTIQAVTQSISAPGSSNVLIRVQVRKNTGASYTIRTIRIQEAVLSAANLPA